jgi:hypothetical protein
MATWKKVIVSGSAGEFTSVTSSVLTNDQLLIAGVGGAIENSGISYDGSNVALGSSTITSTGATSILSGSFSGSFQGDGSNLTGVVAAIPNSLLLGDGLAGGTFDGQTAVTASLDTGSAYFTEGVREKISVADTTGAAGIDLSYDETTGVISGSLVNSSITLGNTAVDLGATETTLDGLTLTAVEATGSFTGSFTGTFVGTTDLPDLTSGTGISTFTYDGSSTATVAISGAAQLTNNIVTKWDSAAGKFVDSSLTDNGSVISGVSSLQLSGASSSLTGSFTGSFTGDGSGLTGLATTLDVSASNGSGISIDLLTQDLTITGTANEIETSAAGTTLTIGLPDDVVITQDLTVNRNLTVLGTASFQQTTNLEVADRFVLFASGSNAPGDGGIVIQQGTQNVGELFGYDSGVTRWGLTSSFSADQPSFTPDAFMAAVVVGSGTDPNAAPARYDAAGNMFIGTDENIWIYS